MPIVPKRFLLLLLACFLMLSAAVQPVQDVSAQGYSPTFKSRYSLTPADIKNGAHKSTAKVSGTLPSGKAVTEQVRHTQALEAGPGITLTKTGDLDETVKSPYDSANPGDLIRYTFTVENTGNVTLTNITLTDPGAMITSPKDPGVVISDGGHKITIPSLAPGEKVKIEGYHTTLVDDFRNGSYKNTATVTGTLPDGQRRLPRRIVISRCW